MRNRFDSQLQHLNVEMVTMGALCEDAINYAIKALFQGDLSLAEKADELEKTIDEKERDIENICMRLLLQQHPVARDLRTISSALKMISDMERIGDQAADIAEIVKYMERQEIEDNAAFQNLKDMCYEATKMVTESINSFVNRDYDLAQNVIKSDDVVDELFNSIKRELIEAIGKGMSNGQLCLDLLMIAKYLERVGDHATNVAEWVVYSITGKHPDEED